MLSPTPLPDPEPRPTDRAVLARTPGCWRRVSVICHLTFHLLPATLDTTATPDMAAQDRPVAVAVRLSWAAREPHAVTLAFRVGRDVPPVVWNVARDLLAAGLLAPAGLGDVTVLPDPTNPDLSELVLSSPGGRACLRFTTAQVAAFLARLPDPPDPSPAVTSLLHEVAGHDGLGEVA